MGILFRVLPSSIHWFATLGGIDYDYAVDVGTDTSSNVYLIGVASGVTDNYAAIAKYTPMGTLVWQRSLSPAFGTYVTVETAAVDSSGNVHIVGQSQSDVAAETASITVAKYDTSGNLAWQRWLVSTGVISKAYGVSVDTSGNVYVVGNEADKLVIAKFNSSGTVLWQRQLTGGTIPISRGYNVTTDTAGDVFVVGHTTNVSEVSSLLIVKYNSSGVLQWQRMLGSSQSTEGRRVVVGGSGNVYVVGTTNATGAGWYDTLLVKYNSSGSVVWQRTLGGTGTDGGHGIALDASENVYISGYTEDSVNLDYDAFVAQYNSDGTLQWQRYIGGSGSELFYSVRVNPVGNMYIVGETDSTGAGSSDLVVFKLPSNGTKTGTYGTISYLPLSLTSSTSALTESTPNFVDSALSLTETIATNISATSSLTSSTTSIP